MKTKVSWEVLWRQLDFLVTHGWRKYDRIPLEGRELDRLIEEAVLIAEAKDEVKELRLALGHVLSSPNERLQQIIGTTETSEEVLRHLARRVYEVNFPNEPYDPEKEPVELV